MLAVTLAALPAAALVIWATLRSPLARRVVATPTGQRWHVRATPSLGGVGIFTGFVIGIGAAVSAGVVDASGELLGVLGGCTLLFVAGLADDLHGLGPLAKLTAQLAAVAIVLASGVRVEAVDNDVLAVAIAVVWLVGMTNAFNFLDNMDGVAATLAAIACGLFAIDAVGEHPSRLVLVVALSVALACLGFLPFNLRPRGRAAIFMGDSGSQVLGFALGSLALLSTWKAAAPSLATVLLPLFVLAVPILDTALVTVIRLLEGRPIYAGGRDHTSHRLVYGGLSEKRAVLLLAVLAAAVGGTGLAYSAVDDVQLTLVGVLVTFALLAQFGGALAGVDESRPNGSGLTFWRTLELHWGRALEVAGDFVLVTAAFAAAYLLRFEGIGTVNQRELFTDALPVILASRYAIFIVFGLYSSIWRYVGARDAMQIVAAVLLSEAVAVGLLAISDETAFATFSRSVFAIDALLCTVLIGASRFGARALARALPRFAYRGERTRTLIVGAGRGGRSLARELHETPGEKAIGFIDDNPRLQRRRLQGVPVLGTAADIDRVLARAQPDTVLVTIPAAPRERLDFVLQGCARAGVPCVVLRRETAPAAEAALGSAE
jgi:UDP-GlcNAc:undecaprenyl-phosphate GlcNAc-1-phosphate transferase